MRNSQLRKTSNELTPKKTGFFWRIISGGSLFWCFFTNLPELQKKKKKKLIKKKKISKNKNELKRKKLKKVGNTKSTKSKAFVHIFLFLTYF